LRTKKSNLIILDANVVIDAHKENYWSSLIHGHRIHLPAIVIRDEIQYFNSGNNIKKGIQLTPLLKKGLIFELEASLEDDKYLQSLVKPEFLCAFDPGEREALALLKNNKYKDFFFCTADRAAVKGLGILSLSEKGISVEKLLAKIGITKPLKNHFTEDWFQKQLRQGFLEKNLWINP
jgi:hypothetical protein